MFPLLIVFLQASDGCYIWSFSDKKDHQLDWKILLIIVTKDAVVIFLKEELEFTQFSLGVWKCVWMKNLVLLNFWNFIHLEIEIW